MTMLDRIKELSKKRNKTLVEVAEDLGLSRHAFYSWDKSSPKTNTLEKVADYFGVSVDYLLGRESTSYQLDTQEEDLLIAFRLDSNSMSEDRKKKFNESIKQMMKIAKDLVDEN